MGNVSIPVEKPTLASIIEDVKVMVKDELAKV